MSKIFSKPKHRRFAQLHFLLLLLFFALPLKADVGIDTLLYKMYIKIADRNYLSGSSTGSLYVKQTVEVEKRNLGLNFIPTLTRFDKDERNYLSEFFYDVLIMDYSLPAVKRKAAITTHRHRSGEMDIVSGYITPVLYHTKILHQGFLSPLHSANKAYYVFSVDSLYSDKGYTKIVFEQKFDNIKLLSSGWVILDSEGEIHALNLKGKDEQCSFDVVYKMNDDSCRHQPNEVSLLINYDFAGNKLNINVDALYNCTAVQSISKRESVYDLSTAIHSVPETKKVDNPVEYINTHRPKPLSLSDSLLYIRKGVFEGEKKSADDVTTDILWSIGDGMISSHTFDWEGGDIKMSPIINPSYISYSSSRGLSYKMKLKLRNKLGQGRLFSFTPTGGYNFKQKTFYWDVDSRLLFDPLHMGSISVDAGADNRTYSSVIVDRIENSAAGSLVFDNLDIHYFKHFYLSLTVARELANGLQLAAGTNFHRRSIVGNLPKRDDNIPLKEVYRQLAPHILLTWQPGMYYYIKDGRKTNVGSRMPRFSLDVEQGISGLFGSNGVYTRAEVDIQHNLPMRGDAHLYLRIGGGGYFHTDDVYFADYAFLRENYLPVEHSDELGGVFQLLDSEWYNAANKYFRAHATYESPFFVLQRLFPKVGFFKSERLYTNLLFMSHLTPYTEFGYGIETPYVDTGIFVIGKNLKFHSFGYKITISLFRN